MTKKSQKQRLNDQMLTPKKKRKRPKLTSDEDIDAAMRLVEEYREEREKRDKLLKKKFEELSKKEKRRKSKK